MPFLFDVIKGVLIGVANIIPGVSGGTMAVSLGIYDNLIYCVTHLFKDFKKCLKILLPYAIGAVLGIVGLAFVIEYLFFNHPLPTKLFFIGLILGGLPIILKRISVKKPKFTHILIFAVFFLFIIGLQLTGHSGGNVVLTVSFFELVKLFLVGMIASATMVIPGVSGSMILMLLGYYQPVLTCVNDFIRAVFALQFDAVFQAAALLIPFGVGVLVGIFAIAKLIEVLLNRYESATFIAILGLVTASPIAILMGTSFKGLPVIDYILSPIVFALGILIALLLDRGQKSS